VPRGSTRFSEPLLAAELHLIGLIPEVASDFWFDDLKVQQLSRSDGKEAVFFVHLIYGAEDLRPLCRLRQPRGRQLCQWPQASQPDPCLDNLDEVFSLLQVIFHDIYQNYLPRELPVKIIKAGVWLGGLRPLAELPTSWLPESAKRAKIFRAVDQVNEKHGLFTVTSGKLLNFKIIKPEVTGYLGDKTYQMQFGG
jgi:hypothetical protein